MGATAGFALKFLQWFFRGVQFCCAALILGIYSYFLATLSRNEIRIPNSLRAVEGIAGAAALYALLGLLLLCCLAGHPATAFVAIALDAALVVGFIYVAVVNRGGASTCEGTVRTVFGTGAAGSDTVDGRTGSLAGVSSLRTVCKFESACLAVAIIAIIFLVLSAVLEVALVRHRRKERRFGPSPANNYTSGYGSSGTTPARRGFNFFGLGRKRRQAAENPNVLPLHPEPGNEMRTSDATEHTHVDADGSGSAGYNKYETAYGSPVPATTTPAATTTTTQPQQQQEWGTARNASVHYPPNYQYTDGTYDRV